MRWPNCHRVRGRVVADGPDSDGSIVPSPETVTRPGRHESIVGQILSKGSIHRLAEGDDQRRRLKVGAVALNFHDLRRHLHLKRANVWSRPLGPRNASLIGRHAGNGNTGVDCWATREQGLGQSWAAVVGKRAEQGVGVDEVGGIEGHGGRVGEEVVAHRDEHGACLCRGHHN